MNDRTEKVIRKRRFTELREFNIQSMDLLRDGDRYIAAGKLSKPDSNARGKRGAGQSYTFAVNGSLDPLWYRQYALKDSAAPIGESTYFYSLCKTSDGGYLAGGQAYLQDTAGVPLPTWV